MAASTQGFTKYYWRIARYALWAIVLVFVVLLVGWIEVRWPGLRRAVQLFFSWPNRHPWLVGELLTLVFFLFDAVRSGLCSSTRIKKGLHRSYIAFVFIWEAFIVTVFVLSGPSEVDSFVVGVLFIPPIAVYVLGWLVAWVIKGFK